MHKLILEIDKIFGPQALFEVSFNVFVREKGEGYRFIPDITLFLCFYRWYIELAVRYEA